jgi:hypothetical protein
MKKAISKKGEAARPLSKHKNDFEIEEATPDQLKKITESAAHAVSLEKQIVDLEAAMNSLKKERDTILNESLPSLLDSAGLENFTLQDGSYIKINDIVRGSLPSADKNPKGRMRALAWLMKNGGKGLIKTSFNTEFGTGQEEMVTKFERVITKLGFAAKKATGVHPQTLCAFVRELLEDGKKVPYETLGIYVGRQAKLELSETAQIKVDNDRRKNTHDPKFRHNR